MIIWRDLQQIDPPPCFLTATIGNFDGLHLGHMSLLKKLKGRTGEMGHKSLVITYSNTPLSVLKPEIEDKRLITTEQKIDLLRQFHIDYLLLLTFTKDFSDQTYEEFLNHLLSKLPIKEFVLGYDTTIGKGKSGTKENVLPFLFSKNIGGEYIEPFKIDGEIVSSRKIRNFLAAGDFAGAERLLGRPFTLYGKIEKGAGRGVTLGFPTLNVNAGKLCTPPLGVYVVKVILHKDKPVFGVANLGVRPTFESHSPTVLEVHLFDPPHENLLGKSMQVQFLHFLRSEMKFESVELLKSQIVNDLSKAKSYIHLTSS